ncbi:hypothetical protein V1L54_23060 [Streptomyces sp. TRM 70361]|uniref:hypothetical protein n=1 Tax=Streptomyces sp. TRM 70361 TaxID=3116553 RepID=UPI002E7B4B8C|nr:hypothetical protein [Streptomyces sp. TRM 70361]MEE1942245.1 hypothetical protein [Streptomyces sp. TRM 70361]
MGKHRKDDRDRRRGRGTTEQTRERPQDTAGEAASSPGGPGEGGRRSHRRFGHN